MNYIIAFLAVTLFHIPAFAQDTDNITFTNFVASKNGVRKQYPIGTRLLIKYASDSSTNKVRGVLAGLSDTVIFIKPSKKEDRLIKVNFKDIKLVRKINTKQTVIYGIVGAALVAGGVAFMEGGGNSPASAMRGALVIPVIAVGGGLVYAVPIMLVIEKVNERRSSHGWSFQSY